MADPRFDRIRAEVEAATRPPDFEQLAARGERLRARRRLAVSGAAALAVVAVVTATLQVDGSGPMPEPVQPSPTAHRGVAEVLQDPRAHVDPEHWALDEHGNLLAVVSVTGRSGDPCATDSASALTWTAPGGASRTWPGPVTARTVVAVPGGFVVGAVEPACRTGADDETTAYVVDARGRRTAIRWDAAGAGAEGCATEPGDPRCIFSVGSARGRFDPSEAVVAPPGAVLLPGLPDDVRWAGSTDSRKLYSSTDGSRWAVHETTLPVGENVTVTSAGDRAAFTTDTAVEVTEDGGETWLVRDLTDALSPITIADVLWTLTSEGTLIGVTTLVGTGDVVFRSTTPAWTAFEEVPLETSTGQVVPEVVGGAVYVVDADRWWVSTDDGSSFAPVSPLPETG